MNDAIIFNEAAFRHGVTEADIRHAIETKVYDGAMENYINKYILIGFDTVGNPLEIMYNIIDSETVNIFHAMKCRNSVVAQFIL
jgi:hypothetical protein